MSAVTGRRGGTGSVAAPIGPTQWGGVDEHANANDQRSGASLQSVEPGIFFTMSKRPDT
jgi:hypothetical protein